MILKDVSIDRLSRRRVNMSRPLLLTIFLLLAGMLPACDVHRVPLEPTHLFHRERPIEIELTS